MVFHPSWHPTPKVKPFLDTGTSALKGVFIHDSISSFHVTMAGSPFSVFLGREAPTGSGRLGVDLVRAPSAAFTGGQLPRSARRVRLVVDTKREQPPCPCLRRTKPWRLSSRSLSRNTCNIITARVPMRYAFTPKSPRDHKPACDACATAEDRSMFEGDCTQTKE